MLNGSDCSSCDWLPGFVSGNGRRIAFWARRWSAFWAQRQSAFWAQRRSAFWAQRRTEIETWNDFFSLETWTWSGPGSRTGSCVWNRMENGGGSGFGCGSGNESDNGGRGTWTWSETGNGSETCCGGLLAC